MCAVLAKNGRMDEVEKAHAHRGLLSSADLGDHPARAALRRRLVVVQPRVYVAETQPVSAADQVEAIRMSVQGDYALLGSTALWVYGLAEPPEVVVAGVEHSTRFRARPPARIRRVSPAVLQGLRTLEAGCVVALEVAVVQAAAGAPAKQVTAMVELVLRERRTTVPRLRSRLRRGLAGSAPVRSAVDELSGTSLDGAVRRLHAALEQRGVTGLLTEVRFTSASGATAYGDLVDEASHTVVEIDGYLSHIERSRFRADRRRDRWMHSEHGLLTVRVDAAETRDDLDGVADELAALLLDRRARAARAG